MAASIPFDSPEAIHRQLKRRPLGRPVELGIVALLMACALVSLGTTVAIIVVLVSEARLFFEEVPIQDFLFETEWSPLLGGTPKYGVWELVAGTANVLLWSMVIALPLGIAAAVYMSEYAHPRTRSILKPTVEALASVPTVVYAFFAVTFVTQDILRPLLGTDNITFFNALSASIMLAVMVLPTIASVSEDAMTNVPRELREAAYGLGATRLEVAFRVVVPAALSGIMAAVLLAVSRVVGETIIVAVAAGSTPNLTLNPTESVQTMTGFMLQIGLGDAQRGTTDYNSLFAVGAALFVMTFTLNLLAQIFVRRFREEYQ